MLKENDEVWVSDVTPWNGWIGIGYCKFCETGPMETYFEFSYRINQGEKIYVSDACHGCTRNLMKRDVEYQSREFWQNCVDLGKNNYDVYREYDLIDNFHLTRSHRVIK